MSVTYPFLIVGAGPGGLMAALELASLFPDKSILILEKNPFTLENYLAKDFGKLSHYLDAMNDKQFSETLISTEKKTVWFGKGNGGGTLHFGLQFINTPEVIEKSYPEWKNDFVRVTEILKPQGYKEPPSDAWKEIQGVLEANQGDVYKVYSNDIYASNIETNERLLIGEFIANQKNITLIYDILIDQLLWDETHSNVSGVRDVKGNSYFAETVILAAGAIQTPAILQRSGVGPKELLNKLSIPVYHDLPVGSKMYDHAGVSLTYTNIPLSSFVWNSTTLKQLYEKTGRYLYAIMGDGIPMEDRGKIYDFTDWVNQHPGGPTAIQKWVNQDFILQYPHDITRWLSNKSKLGPSLGMYNQMSYLADLPSYLQKEFEPQSLDSNTIVGYLQTRNPPKLSWQTYLNALPNVPKSPLIVTYALSSEIPHNGIVEITSKDANILPSVTLNELDEIGVQYILESINITENILLKIGWKNPQTVDASYIREKYDSIYHYHGTCPISSVVSDQYQVIGVNNLYLSDLSVLPKPWGGSTSVPSLVVGYRLAQILKNKSK